VRFNLQFKGAMTNLAPVCIYYQTNGMGNAEWFGPIPGTVFHPTNDCGAAAYRFFIRCTDPDGVNYTANGSLRMLDSPGFVPNALPLPVKTLDFSKIEVLNPPWPGAGDYATKNDLSSLVPVTRTINGQPLTNDIEIAGGVTSVNSMTGAVTITAADIGAAPSADLVVAAQNASDALAYSRATYDFQQGNTNAWFSGTNYVFGADATNKTAFAFEPGMDLAIMPCSLALMELRDGTTQKVWDQRDWTVWYWNFKNAQQEASIAARFAAAAEFNATNYAPIAWGRRTSSGLANPDQKTLWVDAEKTVLAPGMAWESTVEVSGCAYWTIVGSATLSGTTNGVITIKDFEGEPVFSIKKTSSRLVYLECGSEIYTHGSDSQGRITFTMRSSVQPVGEFSTVLDDSLFVSEDDAGCPVDYEWETVSSGVYRIHFLLKPGIVSDACFARFKVEIQGETAVEFSAPQKITGGIIYNDGVHGDVKIRPVITSTAVGSVVTWEVAP